MSSTEFLVVFSLGFVIGGCALLIQARRAGIVLAEAQLMLTACALLGLVAIVLLTPTGYRWIPPIALIIGLPLLLSERTTNRASKHLGNLASRMRKRAGP
jgi:hypothetical protein